MAVKGGVSSLLTLTKSAIASVNLHTNKVLGDIKAPVNHLMPHISVDTTLASRRAAHPKSQVASQAFKRQPELAGCVLVLEKDFHKLESGSAAKKGHGGDHTRGHNTVNKSDELLLRSHLGVAESAKMCDSHGASQCKTKVRAAKERTRLDDGG